MKLNISTKLTLFAIIVIGALLRFHGLNWDQGTHMHPDERAIILSTINLQLPQTINQFLSVDSPWNPHFFAYGSFPFYLLHFAGQIASSANPLYSQYALIQIPGRFISATSDLLVILFLFLLTQRLFNPPAGGKTGLFAAFFYAISTLPIQLSHFYAVDTLLTLFIIITNYLLILFYEKPSVKKSLLIGVFFGLALATKISAIVLVASIGASLVVDFILLFLRNPHRPKHWLPHLPAFLKHLITYAIIIFVTTIIIFSFCEPYALIDFQTFWKQTLEQQAMTKDASVFPYTLQYLGKIPYYYELKNIFFFGLGPMLAILSLAGLFIFTKKATRKEFILVAFIFTYFLIVGKFAIGFMRYMLPLYPFLCLFAALSATQLFNYLKAKNKMFFTLCSLLFALLLLVWPVSFVQIYNHNNTRVDATSWIQKNIPSGKLLLVEHWDDRLPISGSENYQIEDLELYNPDTPEKWQKINSQLQRGDYIIIASNRLYVPLQRLTNCAKLPPYRCYPITALYYKQLFAEQLGYKKVTEFSDYPTIPLINKTINDISADESFTVYDHPKVFIFEKNKN